MANFSTQISKEEALASLLEIAERDGFVQTEDSMIIADCRTLAKAGKLVRKSYGHYRLPTASEKRAASNDAWANRQARQLLGRNK